MKTEKTERLQYLINTVPGPLLQKPGHDFSLKTSPDKWSKKEIQEYLIGNATNNHHRFVRCQFEESPAITYLQEGWNRHSFYQQPERQHLVDFRTRYNQPINLRIQQVPLESQSGLCDTTGTAPVALAAVLDDVNHLEHHQAQIPG